MGWRTNDSRSGARIWDSEAPSGEDLLCRDEELAWVMRDQRRSWQLINGRLQNGSDPTMMAEGLYAGLTGIPPAAYPPSVGNTSTATPGVALWASTLYTPLPANAVMAPSMYKIMAAGTYQLSTTSMTCVLSPGILGVGSGAAPTGGKKLGDSGTVTLATTAITCLWFLAGYMVIQQVGTAGTADFYGTFHYTNAAAPATSAQVVNAICGGTQATAVDFTGTTANFPGGFFLATWGVTGTETWVPRIVGMASWN